MASARGRLSSLDLVPEEGQEDIRWAFSELNKRERSQKEILDELNGRLVDKGLTGYIISKSAFNRASVAAHRASQRLQMQRDIFSGLAPHLTPEKIDEGNIALAEFIKALIGEIISEAEGAGLSADEAMKLSRGFLAVVTAQKLSHDRKTKAEKDLATKTEKAADAVAKVAREAGLSADQVAKIRRDVLGVRT
jgi:hypothetical protein